MNDLLSLDYGCGDGGFLEIQHSDNHRRYSWLDKNGGRKSFAIDINEKYVLRAKEKISNETNFVVMDGRKLAFGDKKFDIVHESGALHHMTNYREGIDEIARVTKSGGVLVLKEVVTNCWYYNIARKMFGKWHGDEVLSWFSSDELISYLDKYYAVHQIEYYWRSLVSDAIAEFWLEPNLSVQHCKYIGNLFNVFGLGKENCCHVVVVAEKI